MVGSRLRVHWLRQLAACTHGEAGAAVGTRSHDPWQWQQVMQETPEWWGQWLVPGCKTLGIGGLQTLLRMWGNDLQTLTGPSVVTVVSSASSSGIQEGSSVLRLPP